PRSEIGSGSEENEPPDLQPRATAQFSLPEKQFEVQKRSWLVLRSGPLLLPCRRKPFPRQPTSARMFFAHGDLRRIFVAAARERKLAALGKAAASPLAEYRHGLAGDRLKPALNWPVQARDQLEQRRRVGMIGPLQDIVDLSPFDQPPAIHNLR